METLIIILTLLAIALTAIALWATRQDDPTAAELAEMVEGLPDQVRHGFEVQGIVTRDQHLEI